MRIAGLFITTCKQYDKEKWVWENDHDFTYGQLKARYALQSAANEKLQWDIRNVQQQYEFQAAVAHWEKNMPKKRGKR